jgi:hypothetical protein
MPKRHGSESRLLKSRFLLRRKTKTLLVRMT